MTNKKIVLFDFCDTLVDFQTANAYVEFVMKQKDMRKGITDFLRRVFNRLSIMKILNRFFPKMSVNKAMMLYQLKGLSYEEMDKLGKQFYQERVCPHFINSVLNELVSAAEDGDIVAVVSGGYDIYLKYFTEEFDIPILLATSLKFHNGVFTGKIVGRDCMGSEKVKRIQECFREEDFENTVGYSDSPSDLPMLSICHERVVVLPDEHIPAWAEALVPKVVVKKGGC